VIIAVTQGRHDTRHERGGEPRLALDQRPRADIVAVEMQKIELKSTSPAALPASDAAWIMLNEVRPSGKTPHSSPSR
jgi:hypothetical protein